MVQGAKEGFDAVINGCYFDPALEAAKQLIDIPVVGSAETSMHIASMMGHQFATVTSDPRFVAGMTEDINRFRMNQNAIGWKPVRPLTLSTAQILECLGGDYEPLIRDFSSVAMGCIEDGAEVVIIGCGLIGPMLTAAGVRNLDGVPIIDPYLVCIKVAEVFAELQKKGLFIVSRKGFHLGTPAEVLEAIMGEYE
jgi:Asp/Glu/hydantoin racemase